MTCASVDGECHNEGAGAGEFLLHAPAACVTTTTVMHAAARGIRIESISTQLRGDVDVKADCTDAELDDLLKFVHGHSPITDTISRPVPVTIRRVQRD